MSRMTVMLNVCKPISHMVMNILETLLDWLLLH
jgi:hypothetical protein